MATSYPYGYAGATLTLAEMATRTTVNRLHPEMRRRMFRMMEYAAEAGVQLGVGTGWRKQPTNPDGSTKPGFAAPGNSYHEGFMPDGTSRPDGVNDRNAMAVDTVLSSAWPWMNANCGRFGLIHFANVNNEPWHIQPVEIPRSRNFATRQPPLPTIPLPGDGSIEEVFVTPEDKVYLDAKFAALVAQVWAHSLPALGDAVPATPAWAVAQDSRAFSRFAARDAAKAVHNTDTLEASVAAIDPVKLQQAITDAVTAALEGVEVTADLTAEDIAAIAEATAQATVAEIAS